jgi:hypothetical protein
MTREQNAVFELALGRILRLGSRPSQPGDIAEYERCRALILDALAEPAAPAYRHSYARDRNKGAAGD